MRTPLRPWLLAVAMSLAVVVHGQDEPPPAPVIVSQVAERAVVHALSLVGTVHPRRTSRVASETEGLVKARFREPGQALRRGEPLLRLANDELAAALIEALADVKLHRARFEDSADLLARDAIARDQALEAEYELDRARSRLQSLQDRIANLTIRAPFDASLVESLVEIGEWVARGQKVAHIAATDTVRVYVNVPERDVARLHTGALTAVTIDALGTDTLEARIVAILAQGYADSRAVPVVVELLNPGGQIRGGMSATVRFAVAQDDALLVHKDAIVTGTSGSHIFLAADGIAVRHAVTTGLAHQGAIAVQGEGLRSGDLAIVRGNERLRDGQTVRVVRKLQ